MAATRMLIGSLEVAIISDGDLALEPERVYAGVPDEDRARVVQVDENGKVPVPINCAVVRSGERRILLDTGVGRDEPKLFGGRYGDTCGRLLDGLRGLGLSPADIDTVVISHAHGDHVGGATERLEDRFVPTFPNAAYWVWKGEWEHWTGPDGLRERPDLVYKLPPLAEHGRLELADSEVDVAPGVRLVAAHGHTPGHVCVALTSGSEMAIYTGDLVVHVGQLEHPEWSSAFDLLPTMAAATRRRIFERTRRENGVLLAAHLPAPVRMS